MYNFLFVAADEIVWCLYSECDGHASYSCCDLENSCFDAIFPLDEVVCLFGKGTLINA